MLPSRLSHSDLGLDQAFSGDLTLRHLIQPPRKALTAVITLANSIPPDDAMKWAATAVLGYRTEKLIPPCPRYPPPVSLVSRRLLRRRSVSALSALCAARSFLRDYLTVREQREAGRMPAS